jgi:hypothetical protein
MVADGAWRPRATRLGRQGYQHRTADRDKVIAEALDRLVVRVEDLVDESDRAS